MINGSVQRRHKHVPDFHASKFPPVANKMFKAFIEAHRKGDMHALAGLTTEELYASLKVTCRLCTERELVSVDGNGKELRSAEGEEKAKALNVTIGTFEVFFGDTSGRWRIAQMRESSVVPSSVIAEPGQALGPK
eukprot:jgi/Undpi1/3107/HiC_scaffold_15.g06481.m1